MIILYGFDGIVNKRIIGSANEINKILACLTKQ